jgi:hypothetical protein
MRKFAYIKLLLSYFSCYFSIQLSTTAGEYLRGEPKQINIAKIWQATVVATVAEQ